MSGNGGGIAHEWVVKYNLDGLEYHTIIFTFLHKRVVDGNILDNTNDAYAKLTTDNERESFARDYIGNTIGKLPSGLIKGMWKFSLSQYITGAVGLWSPPRKGHGGEIRTKTSLRKRYQTLFHELGHDANKGTNASAPADFRATTNYEYFIAAYKDKTHVSVYSQTNTSEHHSEAYSLWCIVQIFIAVYSTTLDTTRLDTELSVISLIKSAILSKNKKRCH